MSLPPLEQASAILGEHMYNYVIIAVDPLEPQKAKIAYDSKYAASGLLKHGITFVEKAIEFDNEYEIVWDDEEEDEE